MGSLGLGFGLYLAPRTGGGTSPGPTLGPELISNFKDSSKWQSNGAGYAAVNGSNLDVFLPQYFRTWYLLAGLPSPGPITVGSYRITGSIALNGVYSVILDNFGDGSSTGGITIAADGAFSADVTTTNGDFKITFRNEFTSDASTPHITLSSLSVKKVL